MVNNVRAIHIICSSIEAEQGLFHTFFTSEEIKEETEKVSLETMPQLLI